MKKIMSAFLALFIFVFAFGCQKDILKNDTPPKIPTSFEADALVIFNETKLTCHINQKSFDNFNIEIYTPSSLEGMQIKCVQEECKLYYKDLEYSIDISSVPQVAFSNVLSEAFKKLVNTDILEVSRDNDNNDWVYKGMISSGKFMIRQDPKTGFVKYISVPTLDLTVEYSNCKILTE